MRVSYIVLLWPHGSVTIESCVQDVVIVVGGGGGIPKRGRQ